jgi:hypothetical protein
MLTTQSVHVRRPIMTDDDDNEELPESVRQMIEQWHADGIPEREILARLRSLTALLREEHLGLIERVTLADGSALIQSRDPFGSLPVRESASDESSDYTLRPESEIRHAEEEFLSRRWHRMIRELSQGFTPEQQQVAHEARQLAAHAYPNLVNDLEETTEYRAGWLDGVHQALRWVLGQGDRVEDASLDTY